MRSYASFFYFFVHHIYLQCNRNTLLQYDMQCSAVKRWIVALVQSLVNITVNIANIITSAACSLRWHRVNCIDWRDRSIDLLRVARAVLFIYSASTKQTLEPSIAVACQITTTQMPSGRRCWWWWWWSWSKAVIPLKLSQIAVIAINNNSSDNRGHVLATEEVPRGWMTDEQTTIRFYIHGHRRTGTVVELLALPPVDHLGNRDQVSAWSSNKIRSILQSLALVATCNEMLMLFLVDSESESVLADLCNRIEPAVAVDH